MKTFFFSRNKLEIQAAQLITEKIKKYLKTKKYVTFGIPGGTSVSGIFNLLKNQKIPWKKVHIFMVDERMVPNDDPDSNFFQAEKTFLKYLIMKGVLPKTNLHPFTYFNFSKKMALNAYKRELREISHFFDIALLSSGEDGHIASLFPNHETINNNSSYFIMTSNSPKAPANRLSASRKLIERSKTALLLFFGANKERAYKRFLDNRISILDCPAKIINQIEDSYIFRDNV